MTKRKTLSDVEDLAKQAGENLDKQNHPFTEEGAELSSRVSATNEERRKKPTGDEGGNETQEEEEDNDPQEDSLPFEVGTPVAIHRTKSNTWHEGAFEGQVTHVGTAETRLVVAVKTLSGNPLLVESVSSAVSARDDTPPDTNIYEYWPEEDYIHLFLEKFGANSLGDLVEVEDLGPGLEDKTNAARGPSQPVPPTPTSHLGDDRESEEESITPPQPDLQLGPESKGKSKRTPVKKQKGTSKAEEKEKREARKKETSTEVKRGRGRPRKAEPSTKEKGKKESAKRSRDPTPPLTSPSTAPPSRKASKTKKQTTKKQPPPVLRTPTPPPQTDTPSTPGRDANEAASGSGDGSLERPQTNNSPGTGGSPQASPKSNTNGTAGDLSGSSSSSDDSSDSDSSSESDQDQSDASDKANDLQQQIDDINNQLRSAKKRKEKLRPNQKRLKKELKSQIKNMKASLKVAQNMLAASMSQPRPSHFNEQNEAMAKNMNELTKNVSGMCSAMTEMARSNRSSGGVLQCPAASCDFTDTNFEVMAEHKRICGEIDRAKAAVAKRNNKPINRYKFPTQVEEMVDNMYDELSMARWLPATSNKPALYKIMPMTMLPLRSNYDLEDSGVPLVQNAPVHDCHSIENISIQLKEFATKNISCKEYKTATKFHKGKFQEEPEVTELFQRQEAVDAFLNYAQICLAIFPSDQSPLVAYRVVHDYATARDPISHLTINHFHAMFVKERHRKIELGEVPPLYKECEDMMERLKKRMYNVLHESFYDSGVKKYEQNDAKQNFSNNDTRQVFSNNGNRNRNNNQRFANNNRNQGNHHNSHNTSRKTSRSAPPSRNRNRQPEFCHVYNDGRSCWRENERGIKDDCCTSVRGQTYVHLCSKKVDGRFCQGKHRATECTK